MYNSADKFTITVKRFIKKIKSFVGFLAGAFLLFGCIYALYYWILYGTNDEIFREYTSPFFNPIAQLLCPDSKGIEVYLKTSYMLFIFLIPCLVFFMLAEMVQSLLFKIYDKFEALKKENTKIQEIKQYNEQFDKIKYFSVAISFEYLKSNTLVSQKTAGKLNKIIYQKLAQAIRYEKTKIDFSNIYTMISLYFYDYDELQESIVKILSKIRKTVKEKYQINTIPTITIDAYTEQPTLSKVINTHLAVKSFNFKNKIISTDTFYKKYNFLGLKKYKGTSIGLYSSTQLSGGKYGETYDLNIIINNLAEKLDTL